MSGQTWGVIGLGWLGLELARTLEHRSQKVWGTHTADFDFKKDSFPDQVCDILFLNTPPLTDLLPADFVQKIKTSGKVIFISSTSVYGEAVGIMTESSVPQPVSPAAKWLKSVEDLLQKKFLDRLTIIRPAGLIGGQRHPVFYLSQKAQASGGQSPINLIHRQDLVEIIIGAAARKDLPLLNAVADFHPIKKDYYNQWAQKLNLAPIAFSDDQSAHRIISSHLLKDLYSNWHCPHLDFL